MKTVEGELHLDVVTVITALERDGKTYIVDPPGAFEPGTYRLILDPRAGTATIERAP